MLSIIIQQYEQNFTRLHFQFNQEGFENACCFQILVPHVMDGVAGCGEGLNPPRNVQSSQDFGLPTSSLADLFPQTVNQLSNIPYTVPQSNSSRLSYVGNSEAVASCSSYRASPAFSDCGSTHSQSCDDTSTSVSGKHVKGIMFTCTHKKQACCLFNIKQLEITDDCQG